MAAKKKASNKKMKVKGNTVEFSNVSGDNKLKIPNELVEQMLKKTGGDFIAIHVYKDGVGVRQIIQGGTDTRGMLEMAHALKEAKEELTSNLAKGMLAQLLKGTTGNLDIEKILGNLK